MTEGKPTKTRKTLAQRAAAPLIKRKERLLDQQTSIGIELRQLDAAIEAAQALDAEAE
jgi:hypothetical protein